MDENVGGLGGFGGFLRKPVVHDTLTAVFNSMVSSPSNNWLQNYGPAYDQALDRRQLDQERMAIEQLLVQSGISPEEAKAVSVNPQAAKMRLDMARQQQEQQSQQGQITRTVEFLRQNDPEIAAMVEAGLPPNEGFNLYAKKRSGGGEEEYGLHPQYGVDAEGNPVLIQLGKSGTSIQTPLPEGVKLSKEPIKLDAKTHWVLLDPITRQQIGIVPKETYQEAFQSGSGTAAGKAVGEDTGTYQSLQSKMPGLEKVVSDLDQLAEQATYTAAGRGLDWAIGQANMEPRESAVARAQYIATVDNQILPLLRDTFGAQFTQKEGETLRATLGDANKTPKEKQAILKAFIEQKRRDVEALGARTGQVPAGPAPAPGGVVDYTDYFGGQ